MSHKTRIRLLKASRWSLILAAAIVFLTAGSLYAGAGVVEAGDVMWKIICALMSALSSICIGIQVWIIKNQTELFTRMGKVEADDQTRKALCDERHKGR
jgi:hypothetical protein